MKIDILTLFPEMFKGPFDESIIRRAKDAGLVEINIHNIRDWAKDKRKTVDDRPFGGGTGMVIRVDIIEKALSTLRVKEQESKTRLPASQRGEPARQRVKEKKILLTPQGKVFNQEKARELAKLNHLILIAGHYEGFDERIREHLVDEEVSIGDYVLTGGELPAMVLIDSIVRLIPGVLDAEATELESFSKMSTKGGSSFGRENGKWKMENLLEFPQFTRPEKFKGWKVPKILLSGNHKEIEKWRKEKALEKTKKMRPDLIVNSQPR